MAKASSDEDVWDTALREQREGYEEAKRILEPIVLPIGGAAGGALLLPRLRRMLSGKAYAKLPKKLKGKARADAAVKQQWGDMARYPGSAALGAIGGSAAGTAGAYKLHESRRRKK